MDRIAGFMPINFGDTLKFMLAVLVTVLFLVLIDPPIAPAQSSSNARPNVILINVDDADTDLFSNEILKKYLPNIGRLAQQGISFTNCQITTPLCGPSRVCLLRGQYAHHTGIKTNIESGPTNNGFSGGYQLVRANGFELEHFGGWLQRAGYRTMMIGKYAHGQVIPEQIHGWDDLHVSFGGNYFAAVRYSTRFPEGQRRIKPDETIYRTVQEADDAVWSIEEHAKRLAKDKSNQPFFLYIAPLAPHKPAANGKMLQSDLAELGAEIRLQPTPDLNEEDISDKPAHLQVPRFSATTMETMQEEHRLRMVAMISVDNIVKRVVDTLQANSMLDNTYMIFTSDHGYQLGHNRMVAKMMPYHRCTHVPLFVMGPGIQPGSAVPHLVSHIDIAPTLVEIAGGKAPIEFDGKSILPLMNNPAAVGVNEFREKLLIEGWEEKSQLGYSVPSTYSTCRTATTIYTEWSNGAREFYDLESDPYQLSNRIFLLSSVVRQRLSTELHDLKTGNEAPIATIATQGLVQRKPVLHGFAEDVEAVTGVAVELVNPATGLYFDGNSWQAQQQTLDAKLLNQDGLLSDWELPVDLSAIENGGSVDVTARSKNSLGQTSPDVKMSFQVDAIEPETELRLPANESTVESPVMFFGVCSDNNEIRGIQFELRNVRENKYWNGNEWVTKQSTFVKNLRAQERWHVNLDLPAGEFKATAAAFDGAGNVDSTLSEKHFFVK